MRSLVKKLRLTLKRRNVMEFLKTVHGAQFPVDDVSKAKAAVSCGLEALILEQSGLPTAGALNLMIKWEKVVVEGKSDALLCCTCMLEYCVVFSVAIRV
jgi:hypothetical protein